MHISIITAGSRPPAERCTTCCNQFHCPLCFKVKPGKWSRLQKHLESHLNGGILFKDKIICRCTLNCRYEGHYHCPVCSKTVLRRVDMTRHLKVCQETMTATSPQQTSPAPPNHKAAVSSSVLLILGPSSSSSLSAEQQRTSALPSSTLLHATVSTSIDGTTSEKDTATVPSLVLPVDTENRDARQILKKEECPHCNQTIYKKNMVKHIQRKHSGKSKDVTFKDHLMSVCIDAKNGISAVQKTRHGLSVPIHVQNKTWGPIHKVDCELEECRQNHLMAVGSGLTFRHCDHIRSLEYCTEMAKEECLKEEVLSEMVALRFFGEAKKRTCLKRQRYAKETHVPLCVQVSLQKSHKHCYFSIHEPSVNHYNRLGRVTVSYNKPKSTWHCPCAKPRRSCVHKNISKWHLYQTNWNI